MRACHRDDCVMHSFAVYMRSLSGIPVLCRILQLGCASVGINMLHSITACALMYQGYLCEVEYNSVGAHVSGIPV